MNDVGKKERATITAYCLSINIRNFRQLEWLRSKKCGEFTSRQQLHYFGYLLVLYFAAVTLFRSRILSIGTKIVLYKTLIRPVVSCGAEAWTFTRKQKEALLIFERKIFRRIYGPKYGNWEWKSRTN